MIDHLLSERLDEGLEMASVWGGQPVSMKDDRKYFFKDTLFTFFLRRTGVSL